jgi:hypothetical protein
MNLVAALLAGVLVAGGARWLIDGLGRLLLAAGRDQAAWLGHHTAAEPMAIGVGLVAAVLGALVPASVPILLGLSVGLVAVALVVRAVAAVLARRQRP